MLPPTNHFVSLQLPDVLLVDWLLVSVAVRLSGCWSSTRLTMFIFDMFDLIDVGDMREQICWGRFIVVDCVVVGRRV
jgi:hypothetical protein